MTILAPNGRPVRRPLTRADHVIAEANERFECVLNDLEARIGGSFEVVAKELEALKERLEAIEAQQSEGRTSMTNSDPDRDNG